MEAMPPCKAVQSPGKVLSFSAWEKVAEFSPSWRRCHRVGNCCSVADSMDTLLDFSKQLDVAIFDAVVAAFYDPKNAEVSTERQGRAG